MREEYVVKTINDIPEVRFEPAEVLGKPLENFKAIVNNDDDSPLHIVGKDYQLTQHKDVFTTIAGLKDYSIGKTMLYRSGRVLCIEVSMKNKETLEFFPKDRIKPMVRVINSYDLTRALCVDSYGLRLVCTNGAVAPVFTARYRRHHSFANISLKELADSVRLGMVSWGESKGIIRKSAKVEIDSEEAILKLKYPKKYAERMVAEVKTPKDTVYNVWNGITWVVSHLVKDNVQTDRLIEFQQTANKIFDYVKA